MRTRLVESALGLGALALLLVVVGVGLNLLTPEQRARPTPTSIFNDEDLVAPIPTPSPFVTSTRVMTYYTMSTVQAAVPFKLAVPHALPPEMQFESAEIRSSPTITILNVYMRWRASTDGETIALLQSVLTDEQAESIRNAGAANTDARLQVNGTDGYLEQRGARSALLWISDKRMYILEANLPPFTRDQLQTWAESVRE